MCCTYNIRKHATAFLSQCQVKNKLALALLVTTFFSNCMSHYRVGSSQSGTDLGFEELTEHLRKKKCTIIFADQLSRGIRNFWTGFTRATVLHSSPSQKCSSRLLDRRISSQQEEHLGKYGIAKQMIRSANVDLIRVESHEGGHAYDEYDDRYTLSYLNGEISFAPLVNDCPWFAQGVTVEGVPLVGVECRGLLNQICTQIQFNEWSGPKPLHPNQVRRSMHFLKTPFCERARLGIS